MGEEEQRGGAEGKSGIPPADGRERQRGIGQWAGDSGGTRQRETYGSGGREHGTTFGSV
jgi:hypothetical protein